MTRRISKLAAVILITAALIVGLASVALASSWSDVPGSLLASYGITNSQVTGISDGYTDGSFKPYQDITRAQFVKMANVTFAIPSANPATPTFSDVPVGYQYYGYIEGAYARGSVNGIGGGRFAPESSITREQAIAIIVRQVATEQGFNLSDLTEAEISTALAPFPDKGSVSPSLREEMAYAVLHTITQGTSSGNLAPHDSVGRLVAATFLIRAGEEEPSLGPTISALNPSSGPTAGGTAVAITGANLSGATEVRFGTVSAEIVANSATQLTALSPPHSAGTVRVSVTTALGTSPDTAADDFTYGTPPIITGINPSSGATAGGTTVTITGTDLSGATAVTFGDTAATSVTVNSATQITAVSPAHAAGTVNVSVTTTLGTSPDTAADDFTYGTLPTITALSPSVGLVGGGTSVIISGANFAGATAVTFGDTAATSVTVDSASQITAVSPAHAAGKVDVSVTTPNGTSANTAADDFTYVVDVSPVTYASYSLGAYREASYGAPPNGLGTPDDFSGSMAGCHVKLVLTFPGAVTINDATAFADSLTWEEQGVKFANSSETSNDLPVGPQRSSPDPALTSYSAAGNTLTIDSRIYYMPGGILRVALNPSTTSGGIVKGITVGGHPVTWQEIHTVVPTGLALKTIAVTAGTATTPASTTMQVTHSANVRSMNHIIWLANGSSIIAGTGTTQAPAAHHHMYFSFTPATSADFIAASGTVTTLDGLGYTVTKSGDTVTITAKTPQAGEILDIKNYDDDFLQANGLSLADHATGVSHPTIAAIPAQTYTGSPLTPNLTVNGTVYNAGTNPAATYTNNVNPGTATASVTVGGCTYTAAFAITGGAPSALGSIQGVVQGKNVNDETVALAGATVTARIYATDPLADKSVPANNIVSTATTDAQGNYTISTASCRGAPLPAGTLIEVSVVHSGHLGVMQYGLYDRPTVVVNFQNYTAQGYGNRTLPYDNGSIPSFPFEHLLPNYLSNP